MVSVNYWVEHQGSRTSMLDTCQMIPVIKSDRADRPWVEFGGDGLYGIYVSEACTKGRLRDRASRPQIQSMVGLPDHL